MAHDLFNIADRDIVLGLSGGVDSAVAAVLLLDAGARVQALHMTNWEDDDGYCTAAEDLQDARRVCEQLGIPLHHVNFANEYRDRVIEVAQVSEAHGCEGILVYTDNGLLDPWSVAQLILGCTEKIAPLVAVTTRSPLVLVSRLRATLPLA